jgi:diphthamide synthase (EF-2-diphthine--ammonia ligase)
VDLPWPCSNEVYEHLMAKACAGMAEMGAEAVAFGDLFLEDVRAYRVKQLAPTGLEPVFPLWGRPTGELAREMIAGGQRARVTCVDPKKLTRDFAGREFDLALLRDLPAGTDPCGENGEFHSFVYESPVLRRPLRIVSGDVVERDGFIFADVLPAD